MNTTQSFRRFLLLFCFLGCSLFSVINAKVISISNEAQLKAIANDLSASYELTSDITLSDEWVPIGKAKPFSGILNGNNHVIRNVKISDATGNVGLFAETYGAVLQNIGIENIQITAPSATNVGGMIGKATASYIENSYITGAKIEGNNVGSFIGASLSRGINPTVITNSYAVADIKSGTSAGGAVGSAVGGTGAADGAAVEYVYFSGTVEAATLCGGIVASTKGQNTVSYCGMFATQLKGEKTGLIVAEQMDSQLEIENTIVKKGDALVMVEGTSESALDTPGVNEKNVILYEDYLYWSNEKWNIREGVLPVLIWQGE